MIQTSAAPRPVRGPSEAPGGLSRKQTLGSSPDLLGQNFSGPKNRLTRLPRQRSYMLKLEEPLSCPSCPLLPPALKYASFSAEPLHICKVIHLSLKLIGKKTVQYEIVCPQKDPNSCCGVLIGYPSPLMLIWKFLNIRSPSTLYLLK